MFFIGLSEVDRRVFNELANKHHAACSQTSDHQSTLDYCHKAVRTCLNNIEDRIQQNDVFKKRTRLAQSDTEINELIIDYARELGASKRQIRQDRLALLRYLDAEALNDRCMRDIGELERELIYLLGRFAPALERMDSGAVKEHWQQLNGNPLLEKLIVYKGDVRVRVAAIKCVGGIAQLNAQNKIAINISINLIQLLFRAAQVHKQETELQISALAALIYLSPAEFNNVAWLRIKNKNEAADNLFVRAEIARLICHHFDRLESAQQMLEQLQNDKSDYVRQELLKAAPQLVTQQAIALLSNTLANEKVDKVAASAVFAICDIDTLSDDMVASIANTLSDRLNNSDSELLTRALLDSAARLAAKLALNQQSHVLPDFYQRIEPAITAVHTSTDNLKIRRWASSAREALWVQCNEQCRAQYLQIMQNTETLAVGKTRQLKGVQSLPDEHLGRVMSLIAQDDFGFDVQRNAKSTKVTRWTRFRFRLWRFLYEIKHSASDKRQAHKHLIGRVFYGLMSVPSARVAEQTLTKVPGEPVTVTDEDGPRNYLPLVDELISSLDQSWPTQELKIYTSEGITIVTPPDGLLPRLKARWALIWNFSHYADLRNWRDGSTSEANEYLSAIADLGFQFSMRGYTQNASGQTYQVHPSVSRFLPAFSLPSLVVVWGEVKDYFASVYANSLAQLWAFMVGMLGLFIGKHAIANWQMNRARKAIPLSVGGWGTRGKSGTERLKAAVFNAMGLKVISKTTGCEAMFLEGGAHQKLRELFLFRPYDKATIWEQVNLMKIAARLKADVFLWECMGLTPAYVHILQRHWMRDDIATITNTYPDHEDVQGPAGIDIPIVMKEFIPSKSTLVTSEEIMLPILRDGCRELDTECLAVTWRDTMTVTDDIMQRFPYEEHQNNIALVTNMCEQLGIPRHFALKTMADNVVLDLGVLKTYPRSQIKDRTLEYVMGNSANERLGAMGNWRRMGFASNTLDNNPEIWVSTIVNNRADRIPRSKVFAAMLVNDVSADAHVIVGTNVDGFETFLHEAWEERYAAYSIWESDADVDEAKARCLSIAERVRIATSPSQIVARLSAMCAELGLTDINVELDRIDQLTLPEEHKETIIQRAQQWQQECQAFNEILDHLASKDQSQSNQQLLELAKGAFFSRVHCYIDPSITGEEIISEIVEITPPGLTNRIMGMQNIKGTGLDFVYRWQAWERCHQACEQLSSEEEAERLDGLKELRAFEEYGQLSRSYVQAKVAHHRSTPQFQMESNLADLAEIEKKVSGDSVVTSKTKEKSQLDRPLIKRAIEIAERFLDLGDAVKRRKKSDQIYQDLINYRISRARAAVELQALTKRQKGGWLRKQLAR